MEKSLELAKEKLTELLEVHKDHPLTTNHDFIDNRRKLQQQKNEEEPGTDMDLVAAEDAFDNMNAYYKVWIHELCLVFLRETYLIDLNVIRWP